MTSRPEGFYWIEWWPDGKDGEKVVDVAKWTPKNSFEAYERGLTICGSDVPLDEKYYNVLVGPRIYPPGKEEGKL